MSKIEIAGVELRKVFMFLKSEVGYIMSCSYAAGNNTIERENANDVEKRKEILRSFSKK